MTEGWDSCGEVLNLLEVCNAYPDNFLEPQLDQAAQFKKLTKLLYRNSVKLQRQPIGNSRALPKLLIDGFDEEQIWQQLELKNIPSLKYFEGEIKELDPDALASTIHIKKNGSFNAETYKSDESDDSKGYVFDDDTDEDSNASDEVQNNQQSKAERKPIAPIKRKRQTELDDQFFKLSQLEEFLKKEDLKAERTEKLSDDESDDEIDYYAEIPSDNYDDEELSAKEDVSDGEEETLIINENNDTALFSKRKQSSRDVMYEDFFDPPDSADEDDDEQKDDAGSDESSEKDINRGKYDTRDYNPTEDTEAEQPTKEIRDLFDQDDSDSEKQIRSKSLQKTTFQQQQEKEQKRINAMEKNLLQPKPWQLTGEVDASHRPENSLMRQPTTFDVNAKQNIELTDDLTTKIEEIIRMAITNKAWGDVERKIKPKEDVARYKRREELDQGKSKKSLAEIYEEDYLKMKHKPEEKEDPRHTEILKLMDTLTPELYALFSHIPKPPVPEIKIVNNMPAITVEEIGPVALSDAALLAPEEIKKKSRGDIKGQTEKSSTDKKRERRKKKVHQKANQKKTEDKMRELAASNPTLVNKHEKLMAMKKMKQHKNTTIVNNEKSKKIKSSKDFFSRLDETVRSKKPTKLK